MLSKLKKVLDKDSETSRKKLLPLGLDIKDYIKETFTMTRYREFLLGSRTAGVDLLSLTHTVKQVLLCVL